MVSEAQPIDQSGAPSLDVSIILPVYNEAEHLEQEVARVKSSMDASAYSYEIIVVNDGSTDNSAEVASRVVFISGGTFTPVANAFFGRVANQRIDKPFNHAQVRELVQQFVR